MALAQASELRDVHGINDTQKELIKAYIQGAVYSWVKNQPGEQFAARDLVGGANFDWTGTPLIALYDKHIAQGKDSDAAIEAAGKDLGWLLKTVLAEDKRTFTATKSGLVSAYCWDGRGP